MSELFASALRLATPLIFAAMGGVICERAGIATICLEGVMLTSAFTAALINYYYHDPLFALAVATLAGVLTMLVHAFLCIQARSDQIISGVAVNMLAAGLTPFLSKIFFGSATSTTNIPMEERFHIVVIPLLGKLPVVGPMLFHHMPLVYIALVLPLLIHYLLFNTGVGLRILASGDGPEALDTAGVSVKKVRLLALAFAGAITSFGGTFLAISHASSFTRDMTAGRGFIALAAVIFGKWRPIPTFFSCLFFGFADALQIQLQSQSFFGFPVQVIQAFPYVVTLVVLVGFVGACRPPRAIGKKD